MAAEIPPLKVSRDSAVVSFSGSWFHSLMVDGKKDSLYVLVLQYGILYSYWWPHVTAPNSWRCGEAGIATTACTMRNIILALACCLLSGTKYQRNDRQTQEKYFLHIHVCFPLREHKI